MTAEAPHFPGSVGISALEVYDSEAPDGLAGGSPHLHTVCTEAYVVTAGEGRLQTLSRQGFSERRLAAGDVTWFAPGTIHRAVNDGGLQAVVIMQNSGLPEAGDAVLTFPDDVPAHAESYRAAADLGDGPPAARIAEAAARRDLAVTGFLPLVAAWKRGDSGPFERFLSQAITLVQSRAADWPDLIEAGPLADANAAIANARAVAEHASTAHLDGVSRHLRRPALPAPGMCGALLTYDTAGSTAKDSE